MRISPLLFLVAGLPLMALAGCQSQPQNIALLGAACEGAAASLNVATSLKTSGKLTEKQINTVDIAVAALHGPCSAATAPTDMNGALSAVTASALALSTVVGGK